MLPEEGEDTLAAERLRARGDVLARPRAVPAEPGFVPSAGTAENTLCSEDRGRAPASGRWDCQAQGRAHAAGNDSRLPRHVSVG